MKSLEYVIFETFLNQKVYEQISEINEEIFSESIILEKLNCKVMQDIVKQIKSYQKQEKEDNSYVTTSAFKQIFGHYYQIDWSKITDSDIEFIDADEWEKNKNALNSKIRKVLNGKEEKIVVCQDKKTSVYKYIIIKRDVINLEKAYYSRVGKDEGQGRPQYAKLDLVSGLNLYIIDVKENKEQYYKKRNDRYESQKGIVYMDEASLANMARANIERYKKIITKNKALLADDSELIDKCGDIIKKVTNFIIEISKDPISNADMIIPMNRLSKYIYDQTRWVNSTGRQQGYYTGVNGLIPLLTKYAENRKNSAKDGYGYNAESMSIAKKEINKTIEKIKEIITQYNLDIDIK